MRGIIFIDENTMCFRYAIGKMDFHYRFLRSAAESIEDQHLEEHKSHKKPYTD